jgi:hypothetical protein
MADGLYMEEEDEKNMLEFKETPSEVSGWALLFPYSWDVNPIPLI